MKVVNTHEAKTQLSSLLAELEKNGELVRICRHGRPIADLIPCKVRDRLESHPVMGKVILHYDPTEPVSDEEWPEHEF